MSEVVIYVRDYCPYCTNAKLLFDTKGVDYKIIDITDDLDKKREMIVRSNRTTVPQVFINGESLGGFDDINALDNSGDLDKKLK